MGGGGGNKAGGETAGGLMQSHSKHAPNHLSKNVNNSPLGRRQGRGRPIGHVIVVAHMLHNRNAFFHWRRLNRQRTRSTCCRRQHHHQHHKNRPRASHFRGDESAAASSATGQMSLHCLAMPATRHARVPTPYHSFGVVSFLQLSPRPLETLGCAQQHPASGCLPCCSRRRLAVAVGCQPPH